MQRYPAAPCRDGRRGGLRCRGRLHRRGRPRPLDSRPRPPAARIRDALPVRKGSRRPRAAPRLPERRRGDNPCRSSPTCHPPQRRTVAARAPIVPNCGGAACPLGMPRVPGRREERSCGGTCSAASSEHCRIQVRRVPSSTRAPATAAATATAVAREVVVERVHGGRLRRTACAGSSGAGWLGAVSIGCRIGPQVCWCPSLNVGPCHLGAAIRAVAASGDGLPLGLGHNGRLGELRRGRPRRDGAAATDSPEHGACRGQQRRHEGGR